MNKTAIPSPFILHQILRGQMFYRCAATPPTDPPHNVRDVSPAEFDAWACELIEEIVHVDRQTWDQFARWRLIVTLLEQGVLECVPQDDGGTLVRETELPAEEKTSA